MSGCPNEKFQKLENNVNLHLNRKNDENYYSDVEIKYLEEQRVQFDDYKNQVINILEKLNENYDVHSREYLVIKGVRNLEYNHITLTMICNCLDILKEKNENQWKKWTYIQQILLSYYDMKSKSIYDLSKIIEEMEIKNNKLNDILKNEKTYEIYKQEERKYKIAYWLYIFASVILTSLGLYGSYYLMNMQKVLEESAKIPVYDYWFLKIAIVLVGITAITFCLKQAIHHQKKRDLAEKNRLELEALPTYMAYFDDEMRTEIYKDLLPKYFGQPIDNTHYTNMSSLIDEQLKLSNEILKSQLNKIGANSDSSTESKSKS